MLIVKKKAEMGMGTLIIFIAMILVAAIAASVLLTTTTSLQNKALDTGRATTAEVGTSLNVISIFADDPDADIALENVTIVTKLSSGSDAQRFEGVLVTLTTSNSTDDLIYDSTIDCQTGENMTAGSEYGVRYVIEGPDNRPGYIVNGDVAHICFNPSRDLVEGEEISISFIPKVGIPVVKEMKVPDLIIKQRETIFP